jgi:pectate lyase
MMKQLFFFLVLAVLMLNTSSAQPSGAIITAGDGPVGFAAVSARGLTSTTGGFGGDTIVITDGNTLYTLLRSLRSDKNPNLTPKVILISGTITADDKMVYIKSCANLTLLGKGTTARIFGFGLEVETSQNIIIRNIEFWDCPVDGIDIRDPETHHIWVDHCSFTDGATPDPGAGGDANHDGALDIKKECTNVTVSWCHFTNHSKTCLFGHTDGETADTVMCATYHHNWFDTTWQRHPRVRFGRVHVLNNLYTKNKLYGVASTCDARVVVEGCYFDSLTYPMHIGYDKSPIGYINSTNNVYSNNPIPIVNGIAKTFGVEISNPHTWNPSADYSYTVDDPNSLPETIKQYAGSGKGLLTTGVESVIVPKSVLAVQNYPNPFNPTTQIQCTVVQEGMTTLKIYDLLGRIVATLINSVKKPGTFAVRFDASRLGSGVYVGVLQSGGQKTITKMLLTK